MRARRLFYSLGVTSLDDVCKYTESQLLEHKNVGDVTILRIKQWLSSQRRELSPDMNKAFTLQDELTTLRTRLASTQAKYKKLRKQIHETVK